MALVVIERSTPPSPESPTSTDLNRDEDHSRPLTTADLRLVRYIDTTWLTAEQRAGLADGSWSMLPAPGEEGLPIHVYRWPTPALPGDLLSHDELVESERPTEDERTVQVAEPEVEVKCEDAEERAEALKDVGVANEQATVTTGYEDVGTATEPRRSRERLVQERKPAAGDEAADQHSIGSEALRARDE